MLLDDLENSVLCAVESLASSVCVCNLCVSDAGAVSSVQVPVQTF